MFVTSAPERLIRLSYAVFGVGILQTRIPSIALGSLTVLLVGLMLARRDPLAGVFGAWILASSYLFLGYSRLGLLETPAAAFGIASLAVLVWAIERADVRLGLLGGVLLAVGLTSKPQSGAAALGMLIGLGLFVGFHRGTLIRVFLAALAGLGVATAAWAAFVLVHLDRSVRTEWRQHALGIGLNPAKWFSNAFHYVSSSDGFGTNARPLLVAAGAGLLLQLVAWARRKPVSSALQFAAAGWSIGMVCALAAISYSPSRYAVVALPGLAIVAGSGVTALRALLPARASAGLAALALAGVVFAAAAGLVPWARWAKDPGWSTRDMASLLRRDTPPGAVIDGGAALVAGTEAHRRVLVTFPLTGINDVCPIERYRVTFVMLFDADSTGHTFFQRLYPGLLSAANVVARPSLIGRPQTLYRVPDHLARSPGC
jgi:4-amino-4-deoxy-L-arabinose transferase-like glycosyltransferase